MYSVVHIPPTTKFDKEQHMFLHPRTEYIFMQTDLLTKEDGDQWIKENIHEDVDNHWVMKTSAVLSFSSEQFNTIGRHCDLNL